MRQIKKGSTDRSAYIRIIDSTDGTPETGVVYNTSGIAMWYRREGATQTAITEASLSALDSAHSDGGIIHIGDGYYRLDLPDAAFATGANSVIVGGAVTGMIVIGEVIQLVNHDVEDGVRMGLTALPNAAADAAGGLPISDAGGLDLDTRLNHLDADITSRSSHSAADVWAVGTRTLTSFGSLVSDIATAVWSAGTRTLSGFGSLVADIWSYATRSLTDKAGFTISGTKQTLDALNDVSSSTVRAQADDALTAYNAPTKAELDAAVAPLATSVALSAVDDYIDTEVTAIKAVTDKLDTAMESDGGVYRFTANALEEGPSGTSGGGDATAANQATIIAHLTDIKGTGFSGTTDSLEAIRDRGDSAWITGSGLSGSNAVPITVQDENGVNIVEASVEIWDSAGTTFYERKTTNSSGQASFNMDDGTYTVKIHKAGYSKADQTLVVPDTLTPIYVMTAYSIPVPSSPDLCRLYMYLDNQDGTHPTTVTAKLRITDLPYDTGGAFYIGTESAGTYNGTTGLLYFDVVRGASVVLTINAFGIKDETFTVPDAATADIGVLI